MNLVNNDLLSNHLGDTGLHHKILGDEVSVMDSMMVGLEKNCLDFHFVSALSYDIAYEIVDHCLSWLRWEEEIFHHFWVCLQLCLCCLIQVIILVINVLQFNQAYSGDLFFILLCLEVADELIAQFNHGALISESIKILES